MNDNDLKALWTAQSARQQEDLRVNRQVLQLLCIDRTQWRLRWESAGLWFQLAVWLVCAVLLGNAVYQTRTALPVLFDLFSIGMVIAMIRQIVLSSRIDYGMPVASIQRQIEALRLTRARTTIWAVAMGTLIWGMATLALAGMNRWWAIGNVAVGLGAVAAASRLPLSKRVVDVLGSRTHREVQEFLAVLEKFEAAE